MYLSLLYGPFRLENLHCSHTRATYDTRTRSSKLFGLSRDKTVLIGFYEIRGGWGQPCPWDRNIFYEPCCCDVLGVGHYKRASAQTSVVLVYMPLTFWVLVYTMVSSNVVSFNSSPSFWKSRVLPNWNRVEDYYKSPASYFLSKLVRSDSWVDQAGD